MEKKSKKEDCYPDVQDGTDVHTEERSLDIGKSAQSGSSGYYNQQGVTQPKTQAD